MVHEFLVDYLNTGEYFKFSILGDKQDATNFLHGYSEDVRFFSTRPPNLKDKRPGREFDNITIVACKYICDKYSPSAFRLAKVETDARKS